MSIITIFEWVTITAFVLVQLTVVILKFGIFIKKIPLAEKEKYNRNISDVYFSITILVGLLLVLITMMSFIVDKLYNQL